MPDILTDLSTESLTAAIEGNLFGYFPAFGQLPGVVMDVGDDLRWSVTDVDYPIFNSVMGARLDPDAADAAIDAAVARATARDVSMLWWVGPSSAPADLPARLLERYFEPAGAAPGMALDLSALGDGPPLPDDFAFTRVSTPEDLSAWCSLATPCFQLPDDAEIAWRALYTSLGCSADAPLTHYLGWQNGRPVAMGSMFLGAGVAGIYNVGTVPGARHHGIGSAMTLRPLQLARDLGYRVGVLQASKEGFGMYQALGFTQRCTFEHYVWSPLR